MTSRTRPASSTTNTARTSSTPTASRSSTTCRSSPNGGRTSIACWPTCAASWCRSRSTARRSTSCSALDLKTDEEAADYLASRAEPVEDIQTSEDVVINAVGRELYELFFRGYTRKQWGLDPSELDKSGDGADPDAHQHRRPLFHRHVPGDAARRLHGDVRAHARPPADRGPHRRRLPRRRATRSIADHIIYTGPIDEYFDFRFGKLPYRSLKFDHQTLEQEQFQPVGTVNYPVARTCPTRGSASTSI